MNIKKSNAIIVAAGSGTRFNNPTLSKQFIKINHKSALELSLDTFLEHNLVEEIFLVIPSQYLSYIEKNILVNYKNLKKITIVNGGSTRQESVKNAFKQITNTENLVLIHDAVRPLVSSQAISKVIIKASEYGAAILANKCKDTLKLGKDNFILKTVDRTDIWQAQTPQAFEYNLLKNAFNLNLNLSDEASLIENLNKNIYLVENNECNLKLTEKEDLKLMQALVKESNLTENPLNLRVGYGVDIHRFEKNQPLFLACVHIPYEYGLLGHSDADVLAHALADALLGAAALGDIGEHFNDKDPQWKNLSGYTLLQLTNEKIISENYKIVNADLTLLAQEPKISPYKKEMCKKIAEALDINPKQINIKASTTERLGFVGEKQGLMAKAVVLLQKIF